MDSRVDFSFDEIECICTTLYRARDGVQLRKFFGLYQGVLFQQLQNPHIGSRYQIILVAYLFALFHAGEFERFSTMMESTAFDERFFKELQDLWYQAKYKENEKKRQKQLGAVEKYRLRRKYPPPRTIWDGQETVYSFKENSRKFLKSFYRSNQYPNQEQKKEIALKTGLDITQVANWFKNRRQRDKTSASVTGLQGVHHSFQPFAPFNPPIQLH